MTTLIAPFCCFEIKWIKKSCVLCRNFISIYKINRTLHSRLGIRILSSRAESISHSFASLTRERYFQHSKIKFVSPRGHVISSIYMVVCASVCCVVSEFLYLQSSSKVLGRLLLPTSLSFLSWPWPNVINVEQNMNVCARNCCVLFRQQRAF